MANGVRAARNATTSANYASLAGSMPFNVTAIFSYLSVTVKIDKQMKLKTCVQAVMALAATIILTNCAGTAPKATFTQPLAEASRISREDKVSTKVTSTDPKMLAIDRQRLGEKITGKVKSIAASRAGTARDYELAVSISRYDKGDAFARAMLAGLGQIHIDGVVTVYQLPARSKLAEFKLNKTFAWGGIYGASVTMDTIEDTYAEAVAQAVSLGK